MALLKCPYCDNEISDTAKKCPRCGKKLKKNKLILPIVIVIIIVIGCIGGFLAWNQYQIIQEEKRQEQLRIEEEQRQEQISNLLTQVEELYVSFDFDAIEKCYDELYELQYDVSEQREILDYDRSVYKDAYAYFEAINDFSDKLNKGGYGSLRTLVDTMKKPTKNFLALEINLDSEIGKYIGVVRDSIMFTMFNSEFVNSEKYNLDYRYTKKDYEYIIDSYTDAIIKEEFPYIQLAQ